jgi:Domain of unknown function (DUF1918)
MEPQIEKARARVGDRVEARGQPGTPARHGQITEILGRTGHRQYRVRWDERHESLLYPADGVTRHRQRPGETGH